MRESTYVYMVSIKMAPTHTMVGARSEVTMLMMSENVCSNTAAIRIF
jgi:hypothetical protein